MAWLSEILAMPYRQSSHQSKPKHTIDFYDPDDNSQTIMPSTSLFIIFSENKGNMAEL